jgi:hypothetical protein
MAEGSNWDRRRSDWMRPRAAGRSITTNNQPRQSGADIVAIALSFFKLSQSESGDAETKKREGGGLRRSR